MLERRGQNSDVEEGGAEKNWMIVGAISVADVDNFKRLC